jgi:hypothetical protein
MAKNNQGKLSTTEKEELRALAREAEDIMLDNARQLGEQCPPRDKP